MTFGQMPPGVKDGAAAERARSLTRQSLWASLGQLLPLAITVLLTPWLLSHLGRERYGLWVVVTSLQTLVTSLDGGASAAVLRFSALFRSQQDREGISGLLLTMTGAALGAMAAAGAIAFALGGQLPDLLHLGPGLRHDALDACRSIGLTVGPLPATAVLLGGLATEERFKQITVQSLGAQGVFAGLTLWLVPGHGLVGLLFASATSRCLALAWAALSVWYSHRGVSPRRLSRLEVKTVAAFAWRSQLASAFGIVNLELDALIVAALLPVGDLAIYGIAASVATGLRTVPLTFSAPMYARLANDLGGVGSRKTESDLAALSELQREWTRWVLGYAVTIAALTAPAVVAWLGSGWLEAGLVAATLTVGHSVNILTAPLSAWTRAIGRPEVEARYGAVSTLINVAATLPLTAAFGLVGLVAATVAGQVSGSLLFPSLVRHFTGLPVPHFGRRLPLDRLIRLIPWVGLGMLSLLVHQQVPSMAIVTAAAVIGLIGYAGRSGLLLRLDRPPAGTAHVPVPR